jgi:hypothetical protein
LDRPPGINEQPIVSGRGAESKRKANAAGLTPVVVLRASVDVTQLFSLRENAIAKEPGSS